MYRAGIFRLRLSIEAQGNMAKLAQIQLCHLTDGGNRILLTAQLEAGARRKVSAKVAMTVDKTKLSHIGGGPFPEGNQHPVAKRVACAVANLSNGGLINHAHEQPLIDK